MKASTAVLVLVLCLASAFAHPQWEQFKTTYDRSYEDEVEHNFRQSVFLDNLNQINEHNERFGQGLEFHTLAVNHLADLTTDEINQRMKGYKVDTQTTLRDQRQYMKPLNFKAPDSVDWRKDGYVTEVKDQGQCGSCWAFSTTGGLEGQHFRRRGELVSLSEQNLVDCSKHGNDGCKGGSMDEAFTYIHENGGIDTEVSYPYEAVDRNCRFKKENVGAHASGYTDVQSGNEHALTNAIASEGPVSVGIDASKMSFHFYSGGVYYEKSCSTRQLDHAVLAVGYGSLDDQDHYIVKNSWGTGWGVDGYIYMSRGRDNNCGIASAASFPTVG